MDPACYPMRFELCSFAELHRLDRERARTIIAHLVDALVESNLAWLDLHEQETPLLYQSGVRYVEDDAFFERQWWDLPRIMKEGLADCKGLAAWRAAELVNAGVPARIVVVDRDVPGMRLFHVLVQRDDDGSREDPSRALGMLD